MAEGAQGEEWKLRGPLSISDFEIGVRAAVGSPPGVAQSGVGVGKRCATVRPAPPLPCDPHAGASRQATLGTGSFGRVRLGTHKVSLPRGGAVNPRARLSSAAPHRPREGSILACGARQAR